VKIPDGTQSGRQFKLRGKGMPVLRSREVGDLHIQARVETPQSLTKRQRELLTEFEAESSNKTHPESAGFFAKMKDFFDNISGA
jgi:molecular chaperone DnaJ